MADTKELIKRIRLTSSAASISFYNIPQDFDDLEIVVSARTTNTGNIWDSLALTFNGVTTNQSQRYLYGEGVSAGSGSDALAYIPFGAETSSATANTFSNAKIYIPNYASSNAKSISGDSVTENNATTSGQIISAALWNSTAAITSISFKPGGTGSFVAYSSFALYGYKGGSDGTTTVS